MAIRGTDAVLPPGGKRLRRHPIKVIYGEPMTFDDLSDVGESRDAMEEIGRRVMSAISSLMGSGRW